MGKFLVSNFDSSKKDGWRERALNRQTRGETSETERGWEKIKRNDGEK